MSSFSGVMMGLAGPIVKKVLVMLGIGTLTYAALTPLINNIIGNAQSVFGQIGGDVAGILGLAGAGQVLGIISGALVARVSFIALGRIGKVST